MFPSHPKTIPLYYHILGHVPTQSHFTMHLPFAKRFCDALEPSPVQCEKARAASGQFTMIYTDLYQCVAKNRYPPNRICQLTRYLLEISILPRNRLSILANRCPPNIEIINHFISPIFRPQKSPKSAEARLGMWLCPGTDAKLYDLFQVNHQLCAVC